MSGERAWMEGMPVTRFPALEELGGWVRHGFVERLPGVEVGGVEREEALARLRAGHMRVAAEMGFGEDVVALAEQVHGAEVAWVEGAGVATVAAGVDGLATAAAGWALGIHVADCCAVYIVDAARRAVALVHSGRKGSEHGIVRRGIAVLQERAGSRAADLVVQLSPCIRPPRYEVDFAAWIRRDARACGVPAGQIHDDGTCTASDLGRFYSYRAEMGRTGRLFAVLGLAARQEANASTEPEGSALPPGNAG